MLNHKIKYSIPFIIFLLGCDTEFYMLSKRAEKNDPKAMYALSEYYRKQTLRGGSYVYQDAKLAREWLVKSAENGYVPAMEDLGAIYDNRFSPESSKGKTSLYWYTKASEAGSIKGAVELAQAYSFGYWGLPIDKEKGQYYYKICDERVKKRGY